MLALTLTLISCLLVMLFAYYKGNYILYYSICSQWFIFYLFFNLIFIVFNFFEWSFVVYGMDNNMTNSTDNMSEADRFVILQMLHEIEVSDETRLAISRPELSAEDRVAILQAERSEGARIVSEKHTNTDEQNRPTNIDEQPHDISPFAEDNSIKPTDQYTSLQPNSVSYIDKDGHSSYSGTTEITSKPNFSQRALDWIRATKINTSTVRDSSLNVSICERENNDDVWNKPIRADVEAANRFVVYGALIVIGCYSVYLLL